MNLEARARLIERGKALFGDAWLENFVAATPLWQESWSWWAWYARIPEDEFNELVEICYEDMIRRDIEAAMYDPAAY